MLINKSKSILISTILLFVVVVAVVVAIVLFNNSDDNGSEVANNDSAALIEDGPCSARVENSLLSRAVPLFLLSESNEETADPEGPKKQFEMEQEIINLENFENDANCLHILSMIYINRSDLLQSEKYVALLSDKLSKYSQESYILDENVNFLSIEDMNNSIESIRINDQQFNTFIGQDRSDERIDE